MDRLIAGRYTQQQQLGEGGMGIIYLGMDQQSEKTVVIKTLKPQMLTDKAMLIERFVQEGEMLRKLDHPNIVKMLATEDVDGQRYIVMEYVSGGSLADLLHNKRKLDAEQTVAIGLELADALTRAHHLRIIHRDIKPDNVLIAEDGTPRLSDFGLARLIQQSDMTDDNLIVGTLAYLSPEALRNEELDERTDIWAFGVVLYEMLSGTRPFNGGSFGALSHSILTKVPDPDLEQSRPDVPIALIDLINRMLEKDPRARISSVRLIGAELEAIQRGTPSPTTTKPALDDDTHIMSSAGRFLTPAPTHGPKHNLPIQPTSFVGRHTELRQLQSLISDPNVRLVTIVGAGGMGKTRLGLAVAEGQLEHYADGVFLVPLAPLNDPQQIVTAIADAVGFQFYGNNEPRQQLGDYFRQKSTLLLLDNFEHVMTGAELVNELLETAPQLNIVATSRERLNLRGETVFNLAGMDVPNTAVTLFLENARYVDPAFELAESNEADIERICHLVDGMPLGIALAAGWVDQFSVAEIAAEIEHGLDFLETSMRDLPDRHQSLRAAIEYSWTLLAEDEQVVLAKASIFRGGFTREAAQSVTGSSLRTLTTLVQKSLLIRNRDSGRYDFHQLMRQFAAEKRNSMADLPQTIGGQHADYFVGFLDDHYDPLIGPQGVKVVASIEHDIGNIADAIVWTASVGNINKLHKIWRVISAFFVFRGNDVLASAVLENIVKAWNGPHDENYGVLLVIWTNYLRRMADERLVPTIDESVAILGQYQPQPATLFAYIALLTRRGNQDEAVKSELLSKIEAALQHDEVHSRERLAYKLYQVNQAYASGDFQETLQLMHASVSHASRFGSPYDLCKVWGMLGKVQSLNEEFAAAEESLLEAAKYAELLGSPSYTAETYEKLSEVYNSQQRLSDALHYSEKQLELAINGGSPNAIARAENGLGVVLVKLGEFETARTHLEHSIVLFSDIEGMGYYFALDSLAELELAAGNLIDARRHFVAAFDGFANSKYVSFQTIGLGQMARLLAAEGAAVQAVEIGALLLAHPSTIPDTRQDCEQLLEKLKEALPADDFEAAYERGKMSELATILHELSDVE